MIVAERGPISVDAYVEDGLVRIVDERFASASITRLDADQCGWLAEDLLEAVRLITSSRSAG